eukprot:Rhum_TRINITY_DN15260_c1_g1::Rhum_TRINITY_DN15260_c1_g1_i2::g.146334::m.146334
MLQALLGEVAELKQQRSITPRTVGSVGDSSELGAALEEAQRERGELDVLQGSPTHQSRTVDDEPASKAELPSVASSPPASSSHEPEWARRLREDFTAKVQSVQESKDPKVEEMLRALLGEVAELKQQRSITPRTVGSVGDSSELGAALEEAQRERGELDRLHEPGTGGVETSSVPAASAEAPAWATALQANIAARLQEIEALSGADGGSADAVAAVVGQLKDELVAKLEEGRAADADTLRACVESLQGGADVRAELRALSEKVDDAVGCSDAPKGSLDARERAAAAVGGTDDETPRERDGCPEWSTGLPRWCIGGGASPSQPATRPRKAARRRRAAAAPAAAAAAAAPQEEGARDDSREGSEVSSDASSEQEPAWARKLRADVASGVQQVSAAVQALQAPDEVGGSPPSSEGDARELDAAVQEACRERALLDALHGGHAADTETPLDPLPLQGGEDTACADPAARTALQVAQQSTDALLAPTGTTGSAGTAARTVPAEDSSVQVLSQAAEPEWARRLREDFEAKVRSVQESKDEPKVAKVEAMLQALLGEVAELKQQRSITPRTVGSVGDSSELG